MTEQALQDITLIKALPMQYEYLPDIRGTREECIAQLKARYPWFVCQGWYHEKTKTAFIPCAWVNEP